MPACDAAIVQMPTVSKAVVVQTDGVVEANAKVRPDDAIAVRVKLPVSSWLPGLLNVIVCVALLIENDCVTGIAAA